MNWTLIVSLFIVVIIHELAHLIAAKLVKCKVEIFSIGFGPTLFKFNVGGTIYQIALIPLGGYCKLKGELEISNDSTTFSNLKYSKKLVIILAGCLINIIIGLLCLDISKYLSTLLFSHRIYAFGYISLVLGLTNLIPFPALDGSYPILVLLEKFFDKQRAYLYISRIVKIGFYILMTLNLIFLPYLIKLLINN